MKLFYIISALVLSCMSVISSATTIEAAAAAFMEENTLMESTSNSLTFTKGNSDHLTYERYFNTIYTINSGKYNTLNIGHFNQKEQNDLPRLSYQLEFKLDSDAVTDFKIDTCTLNWSYDGESEKYSSKPLPSFKDAKTIYNLYYSRKNIGLGDHMLVCEYPARPGAKFEVIVKASLSSIEDNLATQSITFIDGNTTSENFEPLTGAVSEESTHYFGFQGSDNISIGETSDNMHILKTDVKDFDSKDFVVTIEKVDTGFENGFTIQVANAFAISHDGPILQPSCELIVREGEAAALYDTKPSLYTSIKLDDKYFNPTLVFSDDMPIIRTGDKVTITCFNMSVVAGRYEKDIIRQNKFAHLFVSANKAGGYVPTNNLRCATEYCSTTQYLILTKSLLTLIIIVTGTLLAIFFTCCFYCCCKAKRKAQNSQDFPHQAHYYNTYNQNQNAIRQGNVQDDARTPLV